MKVKLPNEKGLLVLTSSTCTEPRGVRAVPKLLN